MHGETDVRTVDEGFVREWQVAGREIELRLRSAGRAISESGLTDEQAAEAIARGELGPFNDKR